MNRTQTGILYRIVILILGLIRALDACAEDPAEQTAKSLLMEMSQAVKNRNYRGTVVYLRDKEAETMRVFHAQQDGIEKERVVALNSPMREVVRSDKDVTCYLPDARLVYVSRYSSHRSFLVQVPENLESNAHFYDYLLAGREYVIQKEAQIIELRPKDEFRYGRKIWVDLETRLPLKFDLFDENGELVEQMMFTDLEVVDQLPADSLAVSSNINTSDWEVRNGESLADVNSVWAFSGVPEGFKQVFHRRSIMPTDKQAVEHILFSDGFSSVSVYMDEPGKDNIASYHKQWGAIHSYSRLLDGYQVTVLGAVPGKTVQAIGDGVNYLKATQR
ncbi:MAG: MucB/RseB C-terminal domain-containing protein [Methylococcales bacterium]